MQTHIPSLVLAGSIGLLTLGTGVTALLQTDLSAGGKSPIGGHYQRLVEDRFDDVIPVRTISQNAWAALKLGLLNQPSAGAYISASGRLFTAEELTQPDTEFDFTAELTSTAKALAAHDIALIPIIVPDKARVYVDDLGRPRSVTLEARYSDVLDVLASNGLPSFDLAAAMQTGRSTSDMFMLTDTHWSPEGARVAAKLIAQEVAKYGLERTAFETTALAAKPFDGDLLSYANTGPFRPIVGPRRETLRSFDTVAPATDALDLFADIEIPVALVGTSFSARTEFHFEGFLRQETGLDLINFAQSGEGPFKPMQDFLASAEFADTPPQIVIWEIPERYIAVKETP